jgi:tetratricopeptide (TPR) repeat protein
MNDSPDARLLQEIYDSGNYERAHQLLLERPSAVSEALMNTLRGEAMRLLDSGDPELGAQFADLAVIAALLSGTDTDKGLCLYCKATVLALLGRYEPALEAFLDARAHLRRAQAPAQLANCLFDTARCLAEMGEYARAIRVLEDSLPHYAEEKDRADALAFILGLELRGGIQRTSEESLARLSRLLAKPRGFTIEEATRIEARKEICERLTRSAHACAGDPRFRASLSRFIEQPAYRVFMAREADATGPAREAYAAGILAQYEDAFNEKAVLGLEAIIFADEDGAAHWQVLSELAAFCSRFGVAALCISDASLGNADIGRGVLRGCNLAAWPAHLLRGVVPGVYSAFADTPRPTHSILLRAEAEPPSFDGAVASSHDRLFRGEGRPRCVSGRQTWDFGEAPSLAAMAQYFFQNGFLARTEGTFSGSIHDQLLHQGYVPRPTVSLSASEDVCKLYATENRRRPGLLFSIDAERLCRQRRVFDSLATLRQHNGWMLDALYDILRVVIRAFDGDTGHVQRSGAFLQTTHLQSRRRVSEFGGGSLGAPVDWTARLGAAELGRLATAGVSTQMLDRINAEFESFWNIADSRLRYMDEIDAESGASRTVELSRAYFLAFQEVQLDLKEAFVLRKRHAHHHPGWDISPFGYVAKTIRDQEFFSGGDIPGDCVLEAAVVDVHGEKTGEMFRRAAP